MKCRRASFQGIPTASGGNDSSIGGNDHSISGNDFFPGKHNSLSRVVGLFCILHHVFLVEQHILELSLRIHERLVFKVRR